MTWDEMCAVDPGLLGLLRRAKAVDDSDNHYCANIAFSWIKDDLKYMVGWFAKNERLRNSECYDLAYHRIYRAIPNCKDCTCL